MRTKTMLLSALLGALGTASVMAQNVYSLNVVGYVNVTVAPGFNMISCPLLVTPTNTIGYLLNNVSNQLRRSFVWSFDPALPGGYTNDQASTSLATANGYTNGWENGGSITMNPGQAVWFQSAATSNVTLTFVGTVASGLQTNTINNGFNMISSILPMSGNIVTNTLSLFTNATRRDAVYVYDTNTPGDYDIYNYSVSAGWTSNGTPADPVEPFVGGGFWYDTGNGPISWVEDYIIN